MNLPLILDLSIGLIIVYLALSFLASECQELLTTFFQWRALHLKQSVETLLAGESKPILHQTPEAFQLVQTQIDRSKQLANYLYEHPLIRSLEHESKGTVGRISERISQLTGASKVFAGKASAPSYLPSDTFAATLLELLGLGAIAQALFEQKLKQFIEQTLLKGVLECVDRLRHDKANTVLLEKEWQTFQADVYRTVQFVDRQTTVSHHLSQVASAIQRFLLAAEIVLTGTDYATPDRASAAFLKRLSTIEQELPAALKEAEPNIVEVVSDLNKMAWVAQSLQQSNDRHETIAALLTDAEPKQRFQSGYDLLQTMNQRLKDSRQEPAFQTVLTTLSPHLCDSLELLTKRVQTETNSIEQGMNQLQKEVALWFDRSMDRSAGVYKRNAKGVALILGFLLAVITNTDTLHLIDRLAHDATLRATYSQAASAFISSNPNAIACLQTEQGSATPVNCLNDGTTALRDAITSATNVPIGWNATNWRQQWQASRHFVANGLSILAGWLMSAIAISMGAPFWFNLLNKVVNVRNSGKPPASTSQVDAR